MVAVCPKCGERFYSWESGGLTQRQRETLDFIVSFINEHGYSPSFEEIRSAMNIKNRSGVYRLLDCLEERGFISKRPFTPRAIMVLKTPHDIRA